MICYCTGECRRRGYCPIAVWSSLTTTLPVVPQPELYLAIYPLRGCICPPGSEMTCKGIMCPRKSPH